jgi:ubiquinol-cytochrome c reductase cytochrome c subunit
MNIAQSMRLLATATVVVAALSSVTLSGVFAATASSYTQAQADRGHKLYDANCAVCHGGTFGGTGDVPALAGEGFRTKWFVGSPAMFMAYISANMPQSDPASLDAQTYADIAAYLMSHNRVPAGAAELPTDPAALSNITLPPLQ